MKFREESLKMIEIYEKKIAELRLELENDPRNALEITKKIELGMKGINIYKNFLKMIEREGDDVSAGSEGNGN